LAGNTTALQVTCARTLPLSWNPVNAARDKEICPIGTAASIVHGLGDDFVTVMYDICHSLELFPDSAQDDFQPATKTTPGKYRPPV